MADSDSNKPRMNWEAGNLEKEFQRFSMHCQFMFAGPLNAKSEQEKIGYLMTYIGDKGRDAYCTFAWTPRVPGVPAVGNVAAVPAVPAENETLNGVIGKFKAFCAPQKNRIRATVNFNKRKQTAGERFDDFVTALRMLVKDCDYMDPDRMLRDAIVLRTKHDAVREKCLDEGDDLTLNKSIQIGQNHEAAQADLKAIHDGEDSKVNAVHNHKRDKRPQRKPKKSQNYKPPPSKPPAKSTNDNFKECENCGYNASHEKCPARGQTCGYCHRRGHFKSVCRKRKNEKHPNSAHKVDVDYDSSDGSDVYTHLISAVHDNSSGTKWWSDVVIGGKVLNVQLDTGATRSILPHKVYKELGITKPLSKTDCKLKSYTNHPLQVMGKVTVPTEYKGNTISVEYQVVNVHQQPLLSGDICSQLGMIERINIIDKYPELAKTTGTLPGTYSLKIDPSVPPVVHGPRRQPRALLDKIVAKLKEMERDGHITRVTEPTDWVSSMVTVLKKDKVRICIDPKDLNRAIRREHYPIPTVEEVVASMPPKAKVFSVIDAKSGFLQIKLDHRSSMLTCFNSPIGRWRWLRLPFGIKSAPEVYQRIMDTMLDGIQGARAIMDDILVAAEDEVKHDKIMRQVVERAVAYNLKLNFTKCKLKASTVKYVGHTLTAEGLQPDEDKIRAVKNMPKPESKEDVRRFLGFIQYLSKFLPKLSEVDAPLRDLLHNDVDFHWDKPQIKSYKQLKELCCTTPVLAYFDPQKSTTIQCDASSYALGAALLQEGRPIAYTSRSLNPSEKKWAQIEKETLAIVHACKKFHHYIFGSQVNVESDHKPLKAIFSKPLLAAPMRLQSMMLRLQPYDLVVDYKPGTDIPLGDTLSRANLPEDEPEIEPEMVNMVEYISIAPARYEQLQHATAEELAELHATILKGWPDTKPEVHSTIREYWNYRDELSIIDGVIYKGMKFVVPPSMRRQMLAQIHESHLGIVKCKRRASEAMFWPSLMAQVEETVSNCPECSLYQNRQAQETLRPTKTPDLPWVEVAADLFEWKGLHYLLTIDYFSKFIEVDYLPTTDSTATISALKAQMCRHGIAEKLRTDNGPQFSSHEFKEFCESYAINHVTSSPHFPKSNGEVERAVQTVKRLWSKCKDKNLALLDYRTTALESCHLSPSQLCMGRRMRNKLPMARALLKPQTLNIPEIRQQMDKGKETQRFYHDRNAKYDLPALKKGDPVSMTPLPGTKEWLPATVVAKHDNPRSYIVEYRGHKYRRNRKDLRTSTHEANEGIKPRFIQRRTPRVPTSDSARQQQPEMATAPEPASPTINSRAQSPSGRLADTSAPANPVPPTSSQPADTTGQSPTKSRSGRVSRRPMYLQDYET